MLAKIREVELSDMDQLLTLIQAHASFEKTSLNIREGLEDNLKALLIGEKKEIWCWIVEHEGKIIGYATFMIQYSTWDASRYLYLDCLYLRSECREKGVGTQMMSKIAGFAKQKGLSEIQWQTPSFNEGAISFYRKLGAKNKGKVRFFWHL